ncbi:MAG: response regulator [Enterocloster sp.]
MLVKITPIMIVSLKMPDMNGIEIAGTIRAKVGEDSPIILISAYDWVEMEDAAKAAGINGFINKPMFKSTIYEKINEYLQFTEKE